jgi:16S rRNA (guanine966-N2)-methyltransferase
MAVIITGGAYRGRTLSTDTRARVIRPTSGKVREAIFSSLGDSVEGSRFADLYAGSGAVGLEALSRGAHEAHLVESHPQSWMLIKANCKAVLGDGPDVAKAIAVRADALAFCRAQAGAGKGFDIVFADPPFGDDFSELKEAVLGILAPGGTAIIQFPSRNPPAWAQTADKLKKYGESGVAFFRAEAK